MTFGWDLPPGVTQRMIDQAAGGYDEPPEPCPICGDPECTDPHEEPDMPPGDLIRAAGIACYGDRWQSALARALGVNIRTIRRWTSGEDIPRAGVWQDILELAASRRAEIAALIAQIRRNAAA